MKVNSKGQFIGRGEEVALEILKDIFGENAEYLIQVKFSDLLDEEWRGTLTERQIKETLDIVVKNKDKTMVFRIQDNHHNGFHTQQRDLVQKKTLEWNNCYVFDVWENECPELFKDVKNEKSISELKDAISLEKNL